MRTPLLLTAVLAAGCSFPTNEFRVGAPADAADVATDHADAPPADVPPADVPPADVPVDTTPDAPADVADVTDADDASDASDAADVTDAADASDVPDDEPCPPGQTRCGAECVDLATTTTSCGRCDNRCVAPNATSACSAGACTFTCNAGFADCDMNPSNGCETDLSSPSSCGSCATRCASMNGTATCTGGACGITCSAGFGDCDGNPANGCETNTTTDSANCGGCGRACSNTNGTPSCAAGTCAITCSAGFGNCDANVTNGCETNTTNNVSNCGACGTRCATGQTCARGVCTTLCADTMCSGACVDLMTSVTNCGACGTTCTTANGTPRCAGATCGIASCNTGFANCDSTVGNGCEANIRTDTNNCGACGNRCNFPNATATCAGGVCALGTCNTGFGNCDGNAANGCETDLRTDVGNCGTCSNRCAPANGVGTCSAGVCGIARCNVGFANCDANVANGCEVNLQTDANNCGACGTVCRNHIGGGNTCSSGACMPTCNTGYANCDGNAANGCEVQLATNTNCGACGRTCALACGNTSGACAGTNPGSSSRTFFTIPVPAFIDACSAPGHVNLMPSTDDGSMIVTLPFAFGFFNATYSQANVTTNGWVGFDAISQAQYYTMIPDANPPNNYAAPYLTDLITGTDGVCVATIGTAPSRRWVVEWRNAAFLSDRTRTMTFELVLSEGSRGVQFYYDTMATPPPQQAVNVGIESPGGVNANVVCSAPNACAIATGARLGFST